MRDGRTRRAGRRAGWRDRTQDGRTRRADWRAGWRAIGGRGTLIGAIIGAILVSYAKTKFTILLPEVWLFALGGMFVLVTLFLPKGLMGLMAQLKDKYSTKKTDDNAQPLGSHS